MSLYSQADSTFLRTFDVYLDIGISQNFYSYPINDTTILEIIDEQYGVNNFTIGFSKRKEEAWYKGFSILVARGGFSNYARTIELTTLSNKTTISGEKNTRFNVGGIFEYGKFIKKLSKNKFHTSLGLGLEPFVDYFKIVPNVAGSSLEFFSIGCDFHIIPTFQWSLNKTLAFTIKLPVEIGRVWYFWQLYPGITFNDRFEINGTDALFDPNIAVVKLGISVCY
jgi:hypothetical protein